MASQPSDLLAIVGGLQECARRGDWRSALELAVSLRDQTPPASAADAGQYLNRLRDALIVAKTSRAHLAATLARMNAAARFHANRSPALPSRQEFAVPPEY